jgi:geranylgeranyl pyrophosphate synthase
MNEPPVEALVLNRCVRYVRARAVTDEQCALLEAALTGLGSRVRDAGPAGYLGCVRVPLLVYSCLKGDWAPALPLATANTLLHAGIDILDDVMDGDPRPWWREFRSAEVMLAAAILICALPQLALAELDAPPGTIVAMQHALATAGLVMAAGQQRDVVMTDRNDALAEAVLASVEAKSGEAMAVAATLAAELAAAPAAQVDAGARLGRALGTAVQLRSDCLDLLAEADSGDLRHGTRTLPLALYLTSTSGPRREEMIELLALSRTDYVARTRVRALLVHSEVMRQTDAIIEMYCGHAYTALRDLSGDGPAAGALRDMVLHCSTVPDHLTEGGDR